MKIAGVRRMTTGMIATVLVAAVPGISSSLPNATDAPTQMVVTVLPTKDGVQPNSLDAKDLMVQQGRKHVPVVRLDRLTGDLSDMQLFILLDDSTRSTSLGNHLAELKAFIESLPATTQVAVLCGGIKVDGGKNIILGDDRGGGRAREAAKRSQHLRRRAAGHQDWQSGAPMQRGRRP